MDFHSVPSEKNAHSFRGDVGRSPPSPRFARLPWKRRRWSGGPISASEKTLTSITAADAGRLSIAPLGDGGRAFNRTCARWTQSADVRFYRSGRNGNPITLALFVGNATVCQLWREEVHAAGRGGRGRRSSALTQVASRSCGSRRFRLSRLHAWLWPPLTAPWPLT